MDLKTLLSLATLKLLLRDLFSFDCLSLSMFILLGKTYNNFYFLNSPSKLPIADAVFLISFIISSGNVLVSLTKSTPNMLMNLPSNEWIANKYPLLHPVSVAIYLKQYVEIFAEN